MPHAGRVPASRTAARKRGTRMTLVRLGDGSLLMHSPIRISSSLEAEIGHIGLVKHIVSPNKLHYPPPGVCMGTGTQVAIS